MLLSALARLPVMVTLEGAIVIRRFAAAAFLDYVVATI